MAYIVTEMVDSVDGLELWDAPGGYEIDTEASEIDEKGSGTLVLVSSPGWEARRAERHRRRAEAAALAARPKDEDEDD